MAATSRGDKEHSLWNPENVKDVAESVGISTLNEETLRVLSRDVEYRLAQVITEALRFMRSASRTTLTVQDVSQALKVLDVEPLYGYESARPLRFGEASLGPGQPLFYIEDEEVDFEKIINAPLPKVPRDMSFTAHWLAIEGVQPAIPQNPTAAESRTQDLLAKGPSANPALAALAGNDNVTFRPNVKHIISKELVLYFDKIQAAILDPNPDVEVVRLRDAALESVRSDPGLHQLVPYFVNVIADKVTQRLTDDVFTLRQMMELTAALIDNKSLSLDAYAAPLSAPVLTCLIGRRLGSDEHDATMNGDAVREQYELRTLSASLLGKLATNYAKSNGQLRPKLTRTCLKYFLDPDRPAPALYGAISGLSAAGGSEAIRVLVLRNLKTYDQHILQPLSERGGVEFEALVNAIVTAVRTVSRSEVSFANGTNGLGPDEKEAGEIIEFLGPMIGSRIAALQDHQLNRAILEARSFGTY